MQTVQKVAESPYIAAQGFADAGAEWMHMVDLDGAKDAKSLLMPTLLRMLQKPRDFLLRSAEESVI